MAAKLWPVLTQPHPWPKLGRRGHKAVASLTSILSVGGIATVGLASSLWFLGGIGLLSVAFGWAYYQNGLSRTSILALRISLLLCWFLAATRCMFTDDMALGVWVIATGIFLAWRTSTRIKPQIC